MLWKTWMNIKSSPFTLWVLAFLLTAGLSTLIPPMMSPDESSHINRAYLISQGTLLLQPLPQDALINSIQNSPVTANVATSQRRGGRVGGMIDAGLVEFTDNHLALLIQTDKRLTSTDQERLARITWTDKASFIAFPGTGYYFPAIYTPQAVGLAIGQALHFGVAQSYHLARAATLLVCFSLLGWASTLWRPNSFVMAVLLLPMSLFQLMSPTIDGLSTSLAVLAIALFLWSADLKHKHLVRHSWGLAVCIVLIVTCRTHLLPLLLLPFFIAWKRHSRRDFYLGCFVAAIATAWILFALQTTSDVRVIRQQTSAELLLQYATSPMAFLRVVLASLADAKLFTFYEQSFIGILGWLDAPLPAYFYPILWSGLALCATLSLSVSTWRADWQTRLLLTTTSIASVVLMFLALLVTWTPHPATVVQGVQGRYLVVPAILLGCSLSGFSAPDGPRRRRFVWVTVAGFMLFCLTALIMTLLRRYH